MAEAIAALVAAIAEIVAFVIEALAHLAAGSVTIIAYGFSRRFREKKRRQWEERPEQKYIDLGISSACLGVLVGLAVWICTQLPESKPASTNSLATPQPQSSGELRVVIGKRSDQGSNQLTIAVKKETIAKLLRRNRPGTNELQQNGAANQDQPDRRE
jgi:hypothetical protein